MNDFATLRLAEPATTVARVSDELRRALFEGELEAGTPLREQALAASLGVARSTVREALATLVAEGLAVRVAHRGVAVASPSAATVRDVCAARAVLEGAGVRRWADAPEPARAAVHDALAAYVGALDGGASYQELNALHLAFHVALVGLAGSARLVAMQEQLVTELRLALAQVDRIRRNAHEQASSHAELVTLLDRGDADDAAAFLERHLAEAGDAIILALGL